MKKGQYWLVILKAEELFGPDPFGGKEVAKIIALTPTSDQPEFSVMTDGILDGLGIGRFSNCAFSYDIGYLCPNKTLLDKLPSLPKWDGKDLKLWLAARSKDA